MVWILKIFLQQLLETNEGHEFIPVLGGIRLCAGERKVLLLSGLDTCYQRSQENKFVLIAEAVIKSPKKRSIFAITSSSPPKTYCFSHLQKSSWSGRPVGRSHYRVRTNLEQCSSAMDFTSFEMEIDCILLHAIQDICFSFLSTTHISFISVKERILQIVANIDDELVVVVRDHFAWFAVNDSCLQQTLVD
jgi:hypothetical protein